jgi:hypothetical protein
MTEAKPNRVQGMVRSVDQYRNSDPKAVCDGSPAQVLYAVTDARHDVLALWSACETSAVTIGLLLGALKEIAGNGDATGRNPQLMVNIAREALAKANA